MKNEMRQHERKESSLSPYGQVVLKGFRPFNESIKCWFLHDSNGKRVGLVRSFFAVKEGDFFKIFGEHIRTEKPAIVTISMESRRGSITHPGKDITLSELRGFVEAAYPAASSMNATAVARMV
jgi:hypothetical protein